MVVSSSLRLTDPADFLIDNLDHADVPYREQDLFEPFDEIDQYDEEPFDRCSNCGRRGPSPCWNCFTEVEAIERAHQDDWDELDFLT